MAESTATPLQLTAGVGFYSGNAITANTQLANSIAAYNSLAPIASLIYTIGQATSNVSLGISAGTIANLKTSKRPISVMQSTATDKSSIALQQKEHHQVLIQ